MEDRSLKSEEPVSEGWNNTNVSIKGWRKGDLCYIGRRIKKIVTCGNLEDITIRYLVKLRIYQKTFPGRILNVPIYALSNL